MSDRSVLAMAVAAWAGATLAVPIPLGIAALVVGVAAVWRRPLPWCVAMLIVADVLAVRALAGLDPPPEEAFVGTVELVTDPEPGVGGGLRFEARTERGRLLAETASPAAVEALSSALAGERARVVGTTRPLRRTSEWTRSRHLAGVLEIHSVRQIHAGAPHTAAANAYRRMLDRGASTLPDGQRALLAGLVLGDDRAQPPQLTADFRAAGLTHLLAVSGQNVMLVLVIAGPLLRRLRIWPRFVVGVVVIAGFALVTRFEPSVLRAAFVAGVALFARTTGRWSGGVRHLAVAACLLLLVDPLLVHSLGFRLSVAASLGVLTLAPAIADRVPGPRWLRDGLAVTTGAQLAVAPVLVPTLGPMPLAALPANLVAGPCAGALMVWGLTAGTVAGACGGPVAALLHLPSALGLRVLEAVAGAGASLPLGHVDLRHIVAAVAGALASVVLPSRLRILGLVLAAVAVLAPVLTTPRIGAHPAGRGATVWVDGRIGLVDVGDGASALEILDVLRRTRVAAVGLVVVRSGRAAASDAVGAIESRFPIGAVIGPVGLDWDGAVHPPPGLRIRVGRFQVIVDDPAAPMRVRIRWASGPGESAAAVRRGIGSPGARGPRWSPLRRRSTGARRGAGRHRRSAEDPRRRRRGRGARGTVGAIRCRARSCRGARRALCHRCRVGTDPSRLPPRSRDRCDRPARRHRGDRRGLARG